MSIHQWISRRIRVDFKKSVTWHSQLREVNNPGIELIVIASDLVKGSSFPFKLGALLSLPDHQQQGTLHRSDTQPHCDVIKVSNYIHPQGQYHGMMSIVRSSTRSKEDQMIFLSTPDTTSRYEFFQWLLRCGAMFWKISSGITQVDENEMSHSKDSKFWTLAEG